MPKKFVSESNRKAQEVENKAWQDNDRQLWRKKQRQVNLFNNYLVEPSKKENDKQYESLRRYANEDSDLSPSRPSRRQNGRHYESRRRQDEDSDSSPSRTSRRQIERQYESRRRQDENPDLSPPRSSKKHADSHREFSRRRDEDADSSSLRKSYRENYKNYHNHDKRHDKHNDFSSDLNPSKRFRRSKSREIRTDRNDGLSPPRRSQSNSKNIRYRDSDKNFNDSRRDRDRSPRQRKSRWADESPRSQSPQVDRRMKKTLDGKTAGLQDAAALREETAAFKKREAEFFNKMSAEVSGAGQAAVFRDRKTGRRRNLEAEAAVQRKKEKHQEEIDAKYARWGKGLKQVDDRNEKLKQDLYEMSKPLARYADDADLDAQLRAADREGDPMLEYIKQKQIREGKREPDRPSYQGSFMPNRFGIKPGHRWDGVDRSNGYEKRWFEARNAKTAIQEEAYKWSTSDM